MMLSNERTRRVLSCRQTCLVAVLWVTKPTSRARPVVNRFMCSSKMQRRLCGWCACWCQVRGRVLHTALTRWIRSTWISSITNLSVNLPLLYRQKGSTGWSQLFGSWQ